MAKVKIGFSGLTVTEQIERARNIKGKMAGNVYYVTPDPTLVEVDNATVSLENAYNDSRNHDKVKIATMKLRRKEFLVIIGKLAAYVQQASGGDEEIILSSGFDVRKENSKHPDTAGSVTNVRLSDGSNHGKIRVDFDAASNAVIYVIRTALLADFSDAKFAGITTKTHKELGGFEPGNKVYVAVTAFGRENPGPETEPGVSIIVR